MAECAHVNVQHKKTFLKSGGRVGRRKGKHLKEEIRAVTGSHAEVNERAESKQRLALGPRAGRPGRHSPVFGRKSVIASTPGSLQLAFFNASGEDRVSGFKSVKFFLKRQVLFGNPNKN